MITKAAMILNQVAVAHSLFYVLQKQDQMCDQNNNWARNLRRMLSDLPPYLQRSGHPLSRGITILVKRKVIVLLSHKDGVLVTLGEYGRKLART
jgi:hypothetical protein